MARKRYSDEDALKILLYLIAMVDANGPAPKKRGPYKPGKKDISK